MLYTHSKSVQSSDFCSCSFTAVFETHDKRQKLRYGTNLRLQCPGDAWEACKEAHLRSSKRQAWKSSQAKHNGISEESFNSRQLVEEREKLHIGLELLKCLVNELNKGVAAMNPEPECQGMPRALDHTDTSLLISVTKRLTEKFDDLTQEEKNKIGNRHVRLKSALRMKPPPEMAAGAAAKPPIDDAEDRRDDAETRSAPRVRTTTQRFSSSSPKPSTKPSAGQVISCACFVCTVSNCRVSRALQVGPDQAGHLDAWIHGMIVLFNAMKGKAYFGTYLKSGGCVFFLKALVRKDFNAFESAFKAFRLPLGGLLSDAMKGKNYKQNLDMAWNLYAQKKLCEAGFAGKWERAYIELDEFELVLGSMSVYHFGAMYPCYSPVEPISEDWWHLRLHLYCGNKLVKASEAVTLSAEEIKGLVVEEKVAETTIDLLNPEDIWRGMLPLQRMLV